MNRYFRNALLLMTQAGNAIVFGGHPDQAISARCYTEKDTSAFWRGMFHIVNALFFDKMHCEKSHAADVARAKEIVAKWTN